MTLLSRCCRAWMSFVLLQDIGFIWMCCSGRARFILKNYAPEVARQHSLSVVLIGTVRLLLLEYFESGLLHACHLTLTVVYSLSMLGEIFYFGSLNSSVPNIARVVVQVVTAVGLTIAHRRLEVSSTVESQGKKRRLFAKHYMEKDILGPPDSDNPGQYRKKEI